MLKKDFITNAEMISKSEVLNAYGLKLQTTINDSFLHCFIDIEDSVSLAVDTGISDIIITGDLNLNCL